LASIALAASAFATPGFVCVSYDVYSIGRPARPPAALISLTASFTALLKLVPTVAPPPDSSTRPTMGTGCAAATSGTAASASAAARLRNGCFMVLLLGSCDRSNGRRAGRDGLRPGRRRTGKFRSTPGHDRPAIAGCNGPR
jgi:hypothetical protein